MNELHELYRILTGSEERFTKKEIAIYGILYPTAIVAAIVIASLTL